MTSRLTTLMAGGCALLLGMSLSGCAASPQSVTVSDPNASIHFQVPRGWHRVDDASLAIEMKAILNAPPAWRAAYGAGPATKATDFLSFDTAQPFVVAWSFTLNSTASSELSYQTLRDSFLPVTSTRRQTWVAQGFPATGFRQIRDQVLTLSQGVHGVRETYDYTLSAGSVIFNVPGADSINGETDTFDSYALTNVQQTAGFILVVHCTTACYSKYRTQIEQMMSSVAGPRF
jgi:hypothetical protein